MSVPRPGPTISRRAFGAAGWLALALCAGAAAAQEALQAGPQGAERGPYREQAWRIPVRDADGVSIRLIEANLYRPPGDRRRPLVILNHGTSRILAERTRLRPDWGLRLTVFFLGEGYVVVTPIRRGYGQSPGDADEYARGGCANRDYTDAGMRGSRQIGEVAAFMARQSFVEGTRIVAAGQSAGAFAALALGSSNPSGVLGILNFSGGRGSISDRNICGEARLVQAYGDFGRTTRLPSIWLYAENDLFFWPDLVRRFHAAYTNSGAAASLHFLPAFGRDGHGFHRLRAAEPHWQPLARDFLKRLKTGAVPVPVPPLAEGAGSNPELQPREGSVTAR